MAISPLKTACLALLVLTGALFSACIAAQTLSVEGKGTVEIEPEYARMSASVSHTADTAANAQAIVDRVMSRLLAGVDDLPVAADSIDAGQIRIQPRYRWNPRSEAQEFQGYEAIRALAFKLTSLDSLGEALQMLTEQGATTVDAHSTVAHRPRTREFERLPSPMAMPKPMPRLWRPPLASRWGYLTISAQALNGRPFSER